MKKIARQHRHGDVALTPSEGIPKSAKQSGRRRITLALGEATGHAHVIEGDVVMWSVEAQRYLVVGQKGATLTHEEHGVQTVTPGIYEVMQQREWTLEDEWQAVAD